MPEKATALLIEYRAPNAIARAEAERVANATLAGLTLLEPAEFTRDPVLAAHFWNVRSGLLASVGGARPSGSSFILEDVCFPPEQLADGALDLQALFAKHGYAGIIFGHASAGNLHFLITPFLNDPKEIAHYGAFMHDVVELVVGKYDGSLKAEHGTGRNIAPYVEREWGRKLATLMWKLKRLADPENILSPGVILTQDPESHLKNLQTAPTIEATVDRCIQCGFCEPVCPSRNLTTTPRQRIALRREMARQPAGRKGVRGNSCGLRLRRHPDLRGRWVMRDRLPRGHQYRGADETFPPSRTRATRRALRCNIGETVRDSRTRRAYRRRRRQCHSRSAWPPHGRSGDQYGPRGR